MQLSDADIGYVEEILREHVEVGGTRWDHERKTTYRKCACGERCYALKKPDHVDHIMELILWRAR